MNSWQFDCHTARRPTQKPTRNCTLQAIKPDRTVTINVKPATDNIWQEVLNAGLAPQIQANAISCSGNIKARQRMVAQFALAGSLRGLVIGTDHAAEAVMGFFTKFGDGAADLLPLAGLNKRRVRAIASCRRTGKADRQGSYRRLG